MKTIEEEEEECLTQRYVPLVHVLPPSDPLPPGTQSVRPGPILRANGLVQAENSDEQADKELRRA